jgi:N-acetyl-gamma-glutamyl-phosphate reductase
MKSIGIIGGSGYTGGELIRLVLNHPKLDLKFIYSTTRVGENIDEIHKDLLGSLNLILTNKIDENIDVVFLCTGHGKSFSFLKENNFSSKTIIIDLSNDFRMIDSSKLKGYNFVYGLPELQKEKIATANAISNPGCFATAIQLGIIPLAVEKLITGDLHVNAITGSTGAGITPTDTNHFSWRNNNISSYKVFNHQHLGEIHQTLKQLNQNSKIYFIPQRGNFTRGIFSTTYTKFSGKIEDIKEWYREYYKNDPFTHLSNFELNLKQVVNTNNCHIHLHKHEDVLLITTIIDNLVKGASGQAIQNLNLVMGWEEDLGLKLKASIY